MKRLLLFLTIAGVSLSLYGQSRQISYQFPSIKKLNSAVFDNAVRARSSANQRAAQNIILDGFQYDAIITADSGGDFEDNVFVPLNTNFSDNDSSLRFSLNWAVQIFDTLLDVNTLNGYPYAITPVHLDSVDVVIAHENFTGTPDTIIFTVYTYQGQFGITANLSLPDDPITNPIIYSDTVITTTSLSPSGSYSLYTLYPDTTIPGNKKFVVGVHFYGDTTNVFGLRAGYADRCGGSCSAYPSINQDKTIWRMVHWLQGPTGLENYSSVFFNSGVSTLGYVFGNDCNQDGNIPDRDGCEYLVVQNFWMTAYVTVDPVLSAAVSPGASICPNNTVPISVSPVGGTGPYTVTWDPILGLDNPFAASTNATVATTTTFTATITDATSSTITRSVTITVNGITVDAGADQTINCGQVATLVATPGGQFVPSTYSWSNGVVTLNNPVTLAGTYTITATNNFGCTSSDAVLVTIQGVNQTLSFTTNLTNNIGCVGEVINFTNTSTSTGPEWSWSWDFDDGTSSGALSPNYSYSQNGSYTVELSAYTLNGSDTCKVVPATKNLTINPANAPQCLNGVGNTALDNMVEIYPNPTEGVFSLNFKEIGSFSGVVGIYDTKGSLMVEENISSASHTQKTFDLSKAADGVYLVKIQINNDLVIKKLTLNR